MAKFRRKTGGVRLTGQQMIEMSISGWDPAYSRTEIEQYREVCGEAAYEAFMEMKENHRYDERIRRWIWKGPIFNLKGERRHGHEPNF